MITQLPGAPTSLITADGRHCSYSARRSQGPGHRGRDNDVYRPYNGIGRRILETLSAMHRDSETCSYANAADAVEMTARASPEANRTQAAGPGGGPTAS